MLTELLERLFSRNGVKKNSRETAKRRLKIVVAHDRVALSPALVDQMRREIMDVVSRYVEIDPEESEFALESDNRTTALIANLPIRRFKNDSELTDAQDPGLDDIDLSDDNRPNDNRPNDNRSTDYRSDDNRSGDAPATAGTESPRKPTDSSSMAQNPTNPDAGPDSSNDALELTDPALIGELTDVTIARPADNLKLSSDPTA